MSLESPTWPRFLNPELFDVLSKPLFMVGQEVVFAEPKKGDSGMILTYGSGPFTVISVQDAQVKGQRDKSTIMSVGHRQWVQLSKEILLNGVLTKVVYDGYQEQWVQPGNLSYFGKIHPSKLSGAWLKPFNQEKK